VRTRTLSFGLACALALAPSCSNNHAVLVQRDHAAGTGGQGGVAGAGAGSGSGGALTRPPAAGASGVDPNKMLEVPGRSVFTLVHGIVDAELTAFCFARVRDGETTLVGSPVPAGGLAYGQSLSFETLPGVKSESDGVVPYVIAGELSALDGLDCSEAVELAERVMAADRGEGGAAGQGGAAGEGGVDGLGGAGGREPAAGAAGEGGAQGGAGASVQAEKTGARPPALRAGALPGLPAGALAAGYSMLVVAAGCLGARAFSDDRQAAACGDDYTPEHGSLTAEVAMLSRATADGMLSIQALHASHASGDLGVRSMPGSTDGGIGITIVDRFGEGALRPRDPRTMLPVESWGVNSDSWSLNASVGSVDHASELWSVIRERAGIDELENGRGYTLVAIGPSATLDATGFWNHFTFALVDNDPSVR
jgi:hypothetical protein